MEFIYSKDSNENVLYISYFENGNTNLVMPMKGDFIDGTMIAFDHNGTPEYSYYKIHREYYENGELKIIGSLKFDEEDKKWYKFGPWNEYNDKGQSLQRSIYSEFDEKTKEIWQDKQLILDKYKYFKITSLTDRGVAFSDNGDRLYVFTKGTNKCFFIGFEI